MKKNIVLFFSFIFLICSFPLFARGDMELLSAPCGNRHFYTDLQNNNSFSEDSDKKIIFFGGEPNPLEFSLSYRGIFPDGIGGYGTPVPIRQFNCSVSYFDPNNVLVASSEFVFQLGMTQNYQDTYVITNLTKVVIKIVAYQFVINHGYVYESTIIKEAYFINDKIAPSMNFLGPYFFNVSPVTMNAICTDDPSGSGIATPGGIWKFQGEEYPKYDDTEILEEQNNALTFNSEGKYTIIGGCFDKVMNIAEEPFIVTFDQTIPVITFAGDLSRVYINNATVTATGTDALSGIDPVSWQYSLDGGTYCAPGSENNSASIAVDGTHIVTFWVKDKAGNSATAQTTVRIDRVLPLVTLAGDMGTTWTNEASRTLSVTATDDRSGISVIECSRDGTNWTTGASLAFTEEGTYSGYFRAVDAAGNMSSVVSGTVNIDRQVPVVTGFASPPGGWIQTGFSFTTVNVKDSESKTKHISGINPASMSVKIAGGSTIPVSSVYDPLSGTVGSFIVPSIPDGEKVLTFEIVDMAGNRGSAQCTVKIDSTAPSFALSLNGIVSKTTAGWTIPVRLIAPIDSASGISPTGWSYALDSGEYKAFSPSAIQGSPDFLKEIVVSDLSVGGHTLSIICRDNTGNQTTRTLDFLVDNTAPVITVLAPLSTDINRALWTKDGTAALPFPVSAVDTGSNATGLASFTCKAERQKPDQSWEYASSVELNGAKTGLLFSIEGIFRITLTASDNANNTAISTVYAKIDRTPPAEIAFASGVVGSGTVDASASDALSQVNPASFQWKLDSGNWNAGSTATVGEGKNRALTFRVSDYAGNTKEIERSLTVDTSGPEITAKVAPFAQKDTTLAITNIEARDTYTSVTAVFYQIDGGTALPLTGWEGKKASISTASVKDEGTHALVLRAVDLAKNTTNTKAQPFIIDRTAPVVSSFTLIDKGSVLGEEKYTNSDTIQVSVQSTDTYKDGNQMGTGEIRAWYWCLTTKLGVPAVFSVERKALSAQFPVQGLADGTNYLFVRTEDAAGNLSEAISRKILVDRSAPSAPIVSSGTHSYAYTAEQAGCTNAVSFSFKPSVSSRSGIAGYEWRLVKTVIVNGVERPSIVVTSTGNSFIPDANGASLGIGLPDNEENEFYQLFVKCIGGSGTAGQEAVYRFRVDTQPPKNLKVWISPQANGSAWYSAKEALVSWNKPGDMTGVAEYRYFVTTDSAWVGPTNSSDKIYNLETWTKTANNETRIDVKAQLAGKKFGIVTVGVCAIDYAGNRLFAKGSIQNDFTAPQFTLLSGDTKPLIRVSDVDGSNGTSKRIQFGSASDGDGESGLSYISTVVSGPSMSRTITLSPTATEVTLDGLDLDTVYTVLVRAYDKAGNMAEIRNAFATGNAVVPTEYSVPYAEEINGYALDGTRIVNLSTNSDRFETITLTLPSSFLVYRYETIGGVETKTLVIKIPLENVAVQEGIPAAGISLAGKYSVTLDGFTLEGTSLRFDRNTGLSLVGANYTRAIVLDTMKQNRTIAVGEATMGFPPVPRFTTARVPVGDRVSVETVQGFTIDGVSVIRLEGAKEELGSASVSFDTDTLFGTDITLTRADGLSVIPLQDTKVSAESKDLRALISDHALTLTMAEATYTVIRSGLRENNLDIYEATLALPDGYVPRLLTIRNFSIDGRTGAVSQGSDFKTDSLTVTAPNGDTLDVASIGFDSTGRLLAEGSYKSGMYGTLAVTGLVLGNTGGDWEKGASLKTFSTTVHGFPVSATSARVTTQGIFIETGAIKMFGAERRLESLGLLTDALDSVYAAGRITDEFSVETKYGSGVKITGGTVEHSGVYGSYRIPLAPELVGGTDGIVWDFSRIRIESTGVCSGTDTAERMLHIGGYEVKASGLSFNGSLISASFLSLQGPLGFTPATVALKDLSFDLNGIQKTPKMVGESNFAFSGWEMKYSEILLDTDGIGGKGYLLLGEKLGNYVIEFPESRIASDGILTSKEASAEYDMALIHNLPVRLEKASLLHSDTGYTLVCPSPVLSLKWINGPLLVFGNTSIDNTGTIISGGEGKERISFTSANNYRVVSSSYRITSDAILLGGSLAAAWWPSTLSVPLADSGIKLLADYSVVGQNKTEPVVYPFADWNITATGISFGYSELSIASNQVTFNNGLIELGTLAYTTDGFLKKESRREQNSALNIFGNFTTLTETRFDEDGLSSSLFVSLPDQLDGYSILFEPVQLYQDGTFQVEESIDQFGFSVGGFRFACEKIWLNSEGLKIGRAVVTLPTALESKQMVLTGLAIDKNGAVSLEGSNISPFQMWGMTFWLQNLTIINNEVKFYGQVCLPETLPGVLSGRMVAINDFRVGLDGSVRAFDVRLEGPFTIPFLDSWALTIDSLGTRYENGKPVIVIDQANLVFPSGYRVHNAVIKNLTFDPIAGEFDFSKIKAATDIKLDFSGIQFMLTELSITKEMTVGFKGSAQFPSEGVPAFLKGKTAAIEQFEIKKDGSLGTVSVSLSGLSGEISPKCTALNLADGSLTLTKKGNQNLVISVSGAVVLNANAPSGLAGKSLLIETFTIDAAAQTITELKAGLAVQKGSEWSKDPQTINFDPVIFNTQCNDVYVGIEWNAASQNGELSLSGGIIFPTSFPDPLKGKEARITECRIGLDGAVRSFGAGYATEAGVVYDSFGSLQLSDIAVAATLEAGKMRYDLAGKMILPAGKFPEGIAGTTTDVQMVFDNDNGLKTATAVCNLPDQKLYGTLGMNGVSISLDKQVGEKLIIQIRGDLTLPDNFPQGLKGLPVHIQNFSIDTSGEVVAFDIGASNMTTSIFNTATLTNGSIVFRKGIRNEFLVNIGGNLQLTAANLPQEMRDTTFEITTLELSTLTGLKSFDAGITAPVRFSILGGVTVELKSLKLSDSALTLNASAKLPASYPAGLANTDFTLTSFKLGWDGKIQDIQGGLESMSIKLAGFNASIDKLYFEKDSAGQYWVTLDRCQIVMPGNFGSLAGQSFAIKNARFSPDTGKFMGDIETPTMSPDFCGFKLVLENPSIEFSKKQITFSKATLETPDFIGNVAINLQAVCISASSGFQVGGGGFAIPGFKVGELSFMNVAANFVLSGSTYSIQGTGGVVIPGAGMLSASLSFTNVSKTYPIGLEHAEFSYVINGLGIPLGSTGLYMNGLKGGLSYNYPPDLPPKIKNMMGSGTWLMIGLQVVDGSGGSLIRLNATTWVNITNIAWAFKGDATILSGAFNTGASITAALSSKGFYADMYISITFARGSIEVCVFSKDGRTKFTGKGVVEFILPTGQIVHESFSVRYPVASRWKVRWETKRWEFNLPPYNIGLGSVGAEFGNFVGGYTGFKGYVDIGWGVGRVGVFAAPGRFDLKISNYTLEQPDWNRNLSPSRSFARINPSIVSFDFRDKNPTSDITYSFRIPGVKRKAETAISASVRSTNSAPVMRSKVLEKPSLSDDGESGLERLLFVVAYAEGDPELTAISPSGIKYRPNDPNVETIYIENGVIFVVLTPEAGKWNFQVSNIPEDSYKVHVMGKESMPLITIDAPSYNKQRVATSFPVKGVTNRVDGQVALFATINEETPGTELGVFSIAQDGTYTGEISTSSIGDGEYLVYAKLVTTGDEVSPTVFASGSILVDRSAESFLAPDAVRVAESEGGSITLRWENMNGARTTGYYVKLKNLSEVSETRQNVGDINTLTMTGFPKGTSLELSVIAYNSAMTESEESEALAITVGGVKPLCNKPVMSVARITSAGTAGSYISGTIPVGVASFSASDGAEGYFLARSLGSYNAKDIQIGFGKPVAVSANGATIEWSASIPETQLPGTYEYACEIVNEANPALNASFIMVYTVTYPKPVILEMNPGKIDGRTENSITIQGSNFVPGTRVFFEGKEVFIARAASAGVNTCEMKIMLPPATQRGAVPLTITGPGGDSVSQMLEVHLPDWSASLQTRTVETVAGGDAGYPVNVDSIDGFTESVQFSIVSIPSGLTIDLPAVSPDNDGTLRIFVAKSVLPGEYTTVITGGVGKSLELVTIVRETAPSPTIVSITPPYGFTGDPVSIYGYGFGAEGTVTLNGKEIELFSWSNDHINFYVPEDATSGVLYAKNAAGKSNEVQFTLKDRGFALKPAENRIELSVAEETAFNIALVGYADVVTLKAEAELDAPLSVTLDKVSVKPNATIRLSVRVLDTAKNGSWKVRVTGSSRGFETSTEITVLVGNAFMINSEPLPPGTVDVLYRSVLSSSNARGQVAYTLESGELPLGLALNRRGEITGRPAQAGQNTVTVSATDEGGKKDARKFVITINEDVWGQAAKDGGKSRAVGTDLPSTDHSAWTANRKLKVSSLLVASNRVVAVNQEGITAFGIDGGNYAWSSKNEYSKTAYAGGKLYALRKNGALEAHDMDIGTVAWTREGVTSFTTDGWTIFARDSEGFALLDAATNALLMRPTIGYANADSVLWLGGVAYEREEKGIKGIYGSEKAWHSQDKVYGFASDADGFVVATQNALVLLDRDLVEVKRRSLILSEKAELSLSADAVLVIDNGYVSEYTRETLEVRWSRSGTGTVALAKEKAVIAGKSGLFVLNRYTGKDIWNSVGEKTAIALYGEKIFAFDANGTIRAYDGIANASAPLTAIELTPSLPDGTNGWYKTLSEMRVVSTDRETFVAETKVQKGSLEWSDAKESEVLAEGEYGLAAYGVDSRGLRGEEARAYVKIDATKPVSTSTVSELEPANGWYQYPVVLTLEGTDTLSGLDRIETNKGPYAGPITIGEEGIYTFSWKAIDRAGNEEETSSRIIRLDRASPYAEARITSERGIAVVTIHSSDSGSGIASVEYRADNGEVKQYTDPIVFMDTGLHRVSYRAIDKAGRMSEWKTCEARVRENCGWSQIIALAETGGEGRDALSPAYPGMPLFEGSDKKHDRHGRTPNRVANLPFYALGGDYIVWNAKDGERTSEPFATFRVKKNAVVYVFLKTGSAAPSLWSLVERKVQLNDVYYAGGADVYMKRFDAGTLVTVPGKQSGSIAPLVIAQESRKISGSIQITGLSSFPDHGVPQWLTLIFGNAGNYTEESFKPLQKVSLSVQVKPYQAASVLPLKDYWYVDTGTGWTAIKGDTYALPWTDTKADVRFRVEVRSSDGVVECVAEKTVSVKNRASCVLYNPEPNASLRGGNRTSLVYSALDATGAIVPSSEVTIRERVNGGESKPIPNPYYTSVPNIDGKWELTFSWESASGHIQETTYTFTVRKRK